MNTHIVGVKGEELAKTYLIKNKYKILEQNYTTKLGEIDIIAQFKNIVVFVEVKQRQSARFGLPREAVTPYKQQKIRRVAQLYLLKSGLNNANCRFDSIDILGEEITHIENAF